MDCDSCRAKPGAPDLCGGCLNNRTLVGRQRAELARVRAMLPREPFDVRCADALADAVDVLVQRKVIDSRSPAADALLDYRNPPSTPRSTQLATAQADLQTANSLRRTAMAEVERLKAEHLLDLKDKRAEIDTMKTWTVALFAHVCRLTGKNPADAPLEIKQIAAPLLSAIRASVDVLKFSSSGAARDAVEALQPWVVE